MNVEKFATSVDAGQRLHQLIIKKFLLIMMRRFTDYTFVQSRRMY